MKGLGDMVAKVTESTGIAAAVKAVAGDNCGCAARRDALNRMFPFEQSKEQIKSNNEFKKVHKV